MSVELSRRALLAALGPLLACPLPGCAPLEPLLRVATNVWPGYETLYLARDLELYDERRLRLIEMPSTTDALRALGAGTVEGAALTLDEMLSARADGLDLVAILVFDVSNGADGLVARRDITSLSALAGKRIAVEQTAVGALMLDAVLRAARLQPRQIRPVYVTADQHLAAFQAGEVDAVVTFEPVLGALRRAGALRLYDSSQLPGAIVDVLAMHRPALQRQPRAVHQLVAGHFLALHHWQQNRTDAAQRMAARLQLDPPAVLQSFEGLVQPDLDANRRWLAGAQPQLAQSARNLHQLMLQARLLQRPAPLDRLCDGTWLPARTQAASA